MPGGEYAPSAGTDRGAGCEPAEGWHLEKWPDGATVAVPDQAPVVHRRRVGD
jgi:hypothetical protein